MKRGSKFLSRLIRTKRVECGLSVKALAQAIGVSDRTLRNWEEGLQGPHGANLDATIRHLNTCRVELVRDGHVLPAVESHLAGETDDDL